MADLLGCSDPGDDILALGVGQVFAVEELLPGVRVAGERDAGPRIGSHVAEDHGHDVHRGAQVMGDLLVLAVVAGALAEPAGEDGLDRQVELVVGIGRERAAGVLTDDRLVRLGDLAQGRRVEIRVLGGPTGVLGRVEGMIEALAVHAHHDPPEHLDEPAIGVPAEALVAGQGDQAVEGLLVEPEVEDRVHHPGHRELGARADAHEERVGDVAEALGRLALDFADGLQDVLPEARRELLPRAEVVVAGLGGNGEPGRHGQPGDGHLGQTRTLAAEQIAHRGIALGQTAAPRVDVALGGLVRTLGRTGRFGHRAGFLRGRS